MTVPHTSGTITLVKGSPDVTGIDTAWMAALIVGGTLYVNVPNVGAMALPILTVDSNTKITAAIPWNGANGTYTYALVRDGSFERQSVENAVKLSALLNEMRSAAVSALAGLTPAADKLPYFGANGAGALADFNAAARALLAGGVLPHTQLPQRLRPSTVNQNVDANTLIESGNYFLLSGAANVPTGTGNWYITVVSQNGNQAVKQFAYGNDSNQVWMRYIWYGAWSAWKRADPPERGSNANGQYTRFADGTQECWYTLFPLSYGSSGDMYSTWNFPASFAVAPLVTITETQEWGGPVRNYVMTPRLLSYGALSCQPLSANPLGTNQPGDIHYVHVFAKGRWS